MEISRILANQIMKDNQIEMSMDDKRTPQQYITELLIYIDEISENNESAIIDIKSDLL